MNSNNAALRHVVLLAPVMLSGGLLLAFLVWLFQSFGSGSVGAVLYDAVRRAYWAALPELESIFTVAFFVSVPVLLLLQALRPAVKQRVLSIQLLVDGSWTIFHTVFCATVGFLYLMFLKRLFDTHLAFLTLPSAADWPWFVRLLLAYLAADFLGWFHHLVRHKVPAFWAFHTVHHSQTHMNPFSRDRVHPVDWMIANSIKFIPAFVFHNSLGMVIGYLFFHVVHDRLNHSNIRTNLGPLRYIFVTPQSHRVHHSSDPRHFDRNFGVSLSIWDHLFGTQWRNYDEYPETGVPDRAYPLEGRSGAALPIVFLAQLAYPFVMAWRECTSPIAGSRGAVSATPLRSESRSVEG